MAETLMTVTIIGILLGVAIPSAAAIARSLRLFALDQTAQQVFVAAQNRLASLAAADGLDAVGAEDITVTEGKAETLDAEDMPEDLYYVTNENDIFSEILPSGAIADDVMQDDATVVVEYDPKSGSVYGVFYAEQSFIYGSTSRDKDKRLHADPLVGYYGGDAVGNAYAGVANGVQARLVNGDELYLELSPAETDVNLADFDFAVTLVQADAPENRVSLPNAAPVSYGSLQKLVLDSVNSTHFASLAWDKIAPGADIYAEVTVSKRNSSMLSKTVRTNTENSLFAGVELPEEAEADGASVTVVNGRHLQNLEPTVSGVSNGTGTDLARTAYAPVNVRVGNVIDWAAFTQTWTTDKPCVTGYTMGGVNESVRNLAGEGAFVSIQNAAIRSFDGQNNGIYNLVCEPNQETIVGGETYSAFHGGGLFAALAGTAEKPAEVKNAEVKNVQLVNAIVRNGKLGDAEMQLLGGTIVGCAAHTTFHKCAVYYDAAADAVIAGTASADEIKEDEEAPAGEKVKTPAELKREQTDYGVFAGSNDNARIGGFAGALDGCTVEDCFAAQPVLGGSAARAGGFAADVTDGTIDRCYANTGCITGAAESGGFAHTVNGGAVQNCYAVGRLNTKTAAGFTQGASNGASFATCYTAATYGCTWLKIAGETLPNPQTVTGFGPENEATYSDGCYYLVDTLYGPSRAKATDEPSGVSPLSYQKLYEQVGKYGDYDGKKRIWGAATAKNTHPYSMGDILTAVREDEADSKKLDETLLTKLNEEYDLDAATTYPFPRLAALEHYGDWPLPAKTGALVYYEQYGDNTVGLDGIWADGTAFSSAHPLSDTKTVLRDGYAWVQEGAADSITFKWDNKDETLKKDDTLTPSGASFAVYPLTAAMLDTTSVSWHQATVNDAATELWFNPHFAKTVVRSTASTGSNELTVRTARHLAMLGTHSDYWGSSKTITQERDVDFSTYNAKNASNAAYHITPIGTDDKSGKVSFGGTYDGGCHTITTASDMNEDRDNVGLFGHIKNATLKNIVFRAKTSGVKINGKTDTGALVGYMNGGMVTNCAVAGFAVSGTNQTGGLIGQTNDGTVTYCAADNASVSCNKGNKKTGGLIGLAKGTTINYCYTLGELSGDTTCGIACSNGSATIMYVYTACTNCKNPITNNAYVNNNLNYYLETAGSGKAQGKTYSELANLSIDGFGKATASYPYASTGRYPFPTSVTNASGAYVHYGDWPAGETDELQKGTVQVGIAIKLDNDKTYRLIGRDASGELVQETAAIENQGTNFLIVGPADETWYYAFYTDSWKPSRDNNVGGGKDGGSEFTVNERTMHYRTANQAEGETVYFTQEKADSDKVKEKAKFFIDTSQYLS